MQNKNSKSHFKVQAAKASWIIPIINLGIMMFGRSGFQTQFGSLLLGGIIICLFVAGIILGIIGIFGYKQYSTKATVLPSIIGIFLNSGLLLLLLTIAISAFNKARIGG